MIIVGQAPYGIKTDERITRRMLIEARPKVRKPSPLDTALRYAKVLQEPSIVSKTQVAERFGVSRARVCQMLNLLELDDSIVQHLMSTKDQDISVQNFWTERRLRQVATIEDKGEQLAEFQRLQRAAQREMALV